jgi:hypothetical protein
MYSYIQTKEKYVYLILTEQVEKHNLTHGRPYST